jgi:hypothetical protein
LRPLVSATTATTLRVHDEVFHSLQLSEAQSEWQGSLFSSSQKSMPLDVFSVADGQIFTEGINSVANIKEQWWTNYLDRRNLKLGIAIGANPPKDPVIVPEMPRLALGKAAARPVTGDYKVTSTQREFDERSATSELRDWMRETGYFAKRPYHIKGTPQHTHHRSRRAMVALRPCSPSIAMLSPRCPGMPTYYGRSLHSSSSDGTDFSSRRG